MSEPLQFPPDPARGDVFERWRWDGRVWQLFRPDPQGGLGAAVHMAIAPPQWAEIGDLWWDGERLYLLDEDEAWVGVSAPAIAAVAEILAALGEVDFYGFARRDGSLPFTGKQSGVAPAATGDNDVLVTAQWVRDRIAGGVTGQFIPIAGGTFTGNVTLIGNQLVRASNANHSYLYYSGGYMHMQADATYMGAIITELSQAALLNATLAMRLLWAGQSQHLANGEAITHSVITARYSYANHRYVQYLRQDGGWYTALYA